MVNSTKPQAGEKWGILGGTFDPVHNGHLTLAREILEKKNLAGILVIPAYQPPHKPEKCVASYEDRVAMLQLSLENSSIMHVYEVEKEESLSGYTLETVRTLKRKFPEVEFYFIIGADNLEDIWNWHKPDKIIKEIKIIAGTRPDFPADSIDRFPAGRVEFVETRPVAIASRDIRRQLGQGKSVEDLREFMPRAVREYIRQRKLYQ